MWPPSASPCGDTRSSQPGTRLLQLLMLLLLLLLFLIMLLILLLLVQVTQYYCLVPLVATILLHQRDVRPLCEEAPDR